MLVDYVRMSVIRGRYKALRVETAEQKSTIAGYEKSISELQATISNLESYTKKLNVMAGLKSPDVLTAPAGVGGGDPGKDEPEPYIEPPQAPAPERPPGHRSGDDPEPEPESPEHREQPDEPPATSSRATACAWPRPPPSCRPRAG